MTKTLDSVSSAADIIVPPELLRSGAPRATTRPTPVPLPGAAQDETAAVFRRLRKLKRALGPKANKNDVAFTLIEACIFEGWNTFRRIVGTLECLDLNPHHVVAILNEGAGSGPNGNRWWSDSDRQYHLHGDGST